MNIGIVPTVETGEFFALLHGGAYWGYLSPRLYQN